MATLFIIPARGGSKGIPGKNIKPLNGKPLIYYSLDVARQAAKPGDIISVSTDDDNIIKAVEDYGFKVDFKRPDHLATDTAGSNEVILHALEFYETKGFIIDKIVLLQPTSPFRKPAHIKDAIDLFSDEIDMVVSVSVAKSNPYYSLFEEDENGFLARSKPSEFTRRQDCPEVYEYNGSIYVINPAALKHTPLHKLTKIRKYIMDDQFSVDLDTPSDWDLAEYMLKKKA